MLENVFYISDLWIKCMGGFYSQPTYLLQFLHGWLSSLVQQILLHPICICTNTHTPYIDAKCIISGMAAGVTWVFLLLLTALSNDTWYLDSWICSLQGVLILLVATVHHFHRYLLGLRLSLGMLQGHFGPRQREWGQRQDEIY